MSLMKRDTLFDQRFFTLKPEPFEEFLAVLRHPPSPNKKLKALFATKAPWEHTDAATEKASPFSALRRV
jgi:uncharacterized protein (DUF1778 family)